MEPLRIVVVGTVNSPHVEAMALEMTRRGHSIQLAGYRHEGQPPSRLDSLDLPYEELPPPFGRGVLDSGRALRALTGGLDADVVHVHYLSRYTFPAVFAGAPLVASTWGSDVLLAKGERADRLFDRLILRRARAITADSVPVREALIGRGVDPGRITMLRWGVDPRIFHSPAPSERERLRAELGLGEGPVLLSPRPNAPLYNIGVIVEAFDRVTEDHPGARLVLKHFGGEPPDISTAAHPDRIEVVGALPYERMGDYYRAADITISVPSSDSSPRSVWEAMACGSACVVSELPWVGELIEPDRDALVVPIEPEALEGALRRLLDEPAFRGVLAQGGLALVAEHHDARREMDRLEEIYRGVVSGS